jgi:hypothetical protein
MPRVSVSRLLTMSLAAGVITGCAGGVGTTDAPERSIRAELQKPAEAPVKPTEPDAAEAAKRTDAASDSDDAAADASEGVAMYALTPERAKTVDLEFSEGLSAPSQEQVVPAPAPWTPAPGAEASASPVIEDVWPVKAPVTGGGKVVLRGKNLQVAQVVFGMAPAKVIEATEDELTVAAPEGSAGEVAIVVTNRDGNYAVAGARFEYYN